MKIVIKQSFDKDINKLPKDILLKIQGILGICEKLDIQNFFQLVDIKKMKWYELFYRIRIGNYRIGIKIIWEEITFIRIKHRKDIYKIFPV